MGNKGLIASCWGTCDILRLLNGRLLCNIYWKLTRKGYQKRAKWSQEGAKMSQGAFKNTSCGTGAKRWGKGPSARTSFGAILESFSMKNPFKKLSKNQSPKNMKFDAKRLPKWSPKRCQNASTIDARTGIEKDQENHENSCFTERAKPSFWAQNTRLLFKNKVREVSSEVNARTGKSSKNHRKLGQNPSPNLYNIDTKFIFKKVMQQNKKIIQSGAQKGAKNHWKTY